MATGILVDGTAIDLTLADSGTFYLSSNPAIATVSADGFVNAVSSGRALVTATHEGVIATLALTVELSEDSDGDSLLDDYEILNTVDPGGANLALRPGTVALASSFVTNNPPGNAIDGNVLTSWFAANGDAANLGASPFIEVVLAEDAGVSQVRILGNRSVPDGRDIFAGIVQAFDDAGAELFNSGEVTLLGVRRDRAVPLDLDGVRSVRFTSTADESTIPGLAEVEVLSRAGGAGFDPADPADAALDFDQDGLTNVEEFALGTNPFSGDTDLDGLSDAQEGTLGSDPLLGDTDFDGLLDGDEVEPSFDRDGDGIVNLLDPDADGDGLPDGLEVRLGLDPLDADTDFDGIPDGSEDADGDGLVNLDEIPANTDPANPDSDGDGLPDGEEVAAGGDGFVTDPLRPDSDGDRMTDGFESRFGLDPTDPSDAGLDPDADGLTNLEEFERGTDPNNPDVTPPSVASMFPAGGAVDVPTNRRVVVRFSEPLSAASVVEGTVRLSAGSQPVQGGLAASDDALAVTFTPLAPLAPQTLHTVEVEGLRDLAGNLLEGVTISTFTTGDAADTTAPSVVLTSPANHQQGVPVNAPFQVELSEPMDPATLLPVHWTVRDDVTFTNAAGRIQVDATGRTASFVPEMPWRVGRAHTVTLSTEIRDAAGNALTGSRVFHFTTSFRPDVEAPVLVAASPADGAVGVPTNARLALEFSEPLNTVAAARGVRLEAGGVAVPGSFAFSDGDRRLSFTPSVELAPATVHVVSVGTELTDLVGNRLNEPASFAFTTADGADSIRPGLAFVDPADGSVEVPRNAAISLVFTEPVDPVSATASDFFVEVDASPFPRLSGTIAVATGGLSAAFVPDALLAPHTRYRVRTIAGITDLAGQPLAASTTPSRFTTSGAADVDPPFVDLVSPSDGAVGVSANSRIDVRLSEPILAAGVAGDAIRLSAGGVDFGGSTVLLEDRRTLRFLKATLLEPSTLYTLEVDGVTDLAGQAAGAFTSTFTTGPDPGFDATRPSVVAVSPPNGSTGVSVSTPIGVTFSENVHPATVGVTTMAMGIDGVAGALAGTYRVEGAAVTFTPASPLPGGVRVLVRASFAVEDLAGNSNVSFSSSFFTEAVSDVASPEVVTVTPAPGATEVGGLAQVVLSFSESLDPTTVNLATLGLVSAGQGLAISVLRSSDNRTITLRPSDALPPDSLVTVVVTEGVRDLSGNGATAFFSSFSTAGGNDLERPSVVGQRPANGATGVPLDRGVVLFTDEALDEATIPGALFVSQNGALVSGDVRITGRGRSIRFVPHLPWDPGALIEVFLSDEALDLAGQRLESYRGSLRTETDPSASPPTLVRTHPILTTVPQPRNLVIEIEYDEPLDPATVSPSTVLVRQGFSGPEVARTVALVRGSRVIRVEALEPYAANTIHSYVVTSQVRDLDGVGPLSFPQRSFTVGDFEDVEPPRLALISPPDGAGGVGLNAQVRLRFSETVNPLTLTDDTVTLTNGLGGATLCTVSFSDQDREVLVVPHEPLAPATAYTLSVDGVEDSAGNPVIAASARFTSAAEPDTTRPRPLAHNPFAGALDVPLNVAVSLLVDESVDPVAVDSSSFRLREDESPFQDVAGRRLVGNDGRIAFEPDAPLVAGRRYRFLANGDIEDLAGNRFTGSNTVTFTVGTEEDLVAPQVVVTEPADGATGIATNARVVIELDEAIRGGRIDQVVLAASGVPAAVARSLSDGNRRLSLIPLLPLAPQTTYTLSVAGIEDLAGNPLPIVFEASFTTADGPVLNP